MKKFIASCFIILGGLGVFTSCEDDRDSNPTIQVPAEFQLNTPAYAGSLINLANSESIEFTWSQPDYGYTAAATYFLQVSATGQFTTSMEQADADESGTAVADYVAMDGVNGGSGSYLSANLAKALMQLCKWEEDAVPSVQKMYVRLESKLAVSGGISYAASVFSNVVEMNVVPYYIELKDAAPEIWYLIGSCIADGKWGSAIGTSIIPMSIIKDYEYDKKTGEGEITFTGYFTDGGFKMVKTPGSWDDQWGDSGEGALSPVMNDGGSKDFKPAPGYYTISLDTKADVMTIKAADIAPTVYETMLISGDFNGWGETAMNPVNVTDAMAGHNHVWSYVLELAEPSGVKFLQSGWSPNWGSAGFPYGVGTSGGDNIPVPAGKYMVVFNDIDGSYSFNAL